MSRRVSGPLLAALIGLLAAAPAAAGEDDLRGVERLRYDCSSTIGRQDLTLFANGTLRLREAQEGEDLRMRLAELGRGELAAYLARLAEEDLSEVDVRGPEAGGEWIESCELKLTLEGRPEHSSRFGRMDSLPLPLGRLLRVVDDLMLEVERLAPRSRLPKDYEPRAGDRLRRFDGTVYRVVGHTGDGAGLELEGVDEPLVIFISLAALRDEFEEQVGRQP